MNVNISKGFKTKKYNEVDITFKELFTPQNLKINDNNRQEIKENFAKYLLPATIINKDIGRKRNNLTNFSLLVFDVDSTTFDTFKDAKDEILSIADDVDLLKYEFVIYETISSKEGNIRFRLIFNIDLIDDFRFIQIAIGDIGSLMNLKYDKAALDETRVSGLPINNNIFINAGKPINLKSRYIQEVNILKAKAVRKEQERQKKLKMNKYKVSIRKEMTEDVAKKYFLNSNFIKNFKKGNRNKSIMAKGESFRYSYEEDNISKNDWVLLTNILCDWLLENYEETTWINKFRQNELNRIELFT
ncbi:MAG: hypothetical protein LBT10_06860 [Methanobrevibacter sp.]|jgi:hypothetical protein|nr:hypothetical protein [Methanobrevibacter sp.]